MLKWRLIAGEMSASGWGDHPIQCLQAVLHQLQRTPHDKATPLSFHIMEEPELPKVEADKKDVPSSPSAKEQTTWQYTAKTFFHTADAPFYRRELKMYLLSKGFNVANKRLAHFLKEERMVGTIRNHNRTQWIRNR